MGWGQQDPRRGQRGNNGRCGRDRIGRAIRRKKTSEGTKASDQENGRAFGQMESQRRGSAWIQREMERETLGIAPCGVEWGGACERSQSMGQGKQNQTDDGRTGSEGRCHGGRDQSGINEIPEREGGGTEDSTLGATSG